MKQFALLVALCISITLQAQTKPRSSTVQSNPQKSTKQTTPVQPDGMPGTEPPPGIKYVSSRQRSDFKPDSTTKAVTDTIPKGMTAPASNPTATASAPDVIITGRDTKGIDDSTVVRTAIDHYLQTRVEGFQQSGLPRFIITGRERKFLLGIGGFVNFRTSFDFAGAVDNRDFITYDIPVPKDNSSRQRFGMDAASSRLFFKAIANSNSLGQVSTYIEMDFRGTTNNWMRLRDAYISFKNLLIGRSVTTFCDLEACPTTVDPEGPNAYTFNFNEIIRYTYIMSDKRWSLAASVETPGVSLTPGINTQSMMQRIPDVPLAIQYKWGDKNAASHVRLSTIMRELRYYDTTQDKAHSRLGWGLQFSGSFQLPYKFVLYMQAVYGHGIARYIQDIAGNGLDLVVDPNNADVMLAPGMGGYFAGLQYNLSKQVFICTGYSHVNVSLPSSFPREGTYNRAGYVFANIFVNVGSSCTLGAEYTFGQRRNVDGEKGCANRVQAMIQYNF